MRPANRYRFPMLRLVIPEFLRFCIVGGIAFVVDATWLELFVHLGLAIAIARIVSLTIALHVSYFLHGIFTYRGHRGYTRATWTQFLLSNIVGALVNYGIFLGVVALTPFADDRLNRLTGMVVGTILSMGFNYWANKRFAFARAEPL